MMAFITLYPDDWQSNSYVALCGTAEHAMLWMLEQNPQLEKVILCLDHDAPGIEATGRLTDILHEHSYSMVAPLQSAHKDWDEDLKAQCRMAAQPAEEHPQAVVKGEICNRIGEKCTSIQADRVPRQILDLLRQYRSHLQGGRTEQAMDIMEQMSASALSVVLQECKQLGSLVAVDKAALLLQDQILPHQNRGAIHNRTDRIASEIQGVLSKAQATGVRSVDQKKDIARAWLNLAISCAKIPVKHAADQLVMDQKQQVERGQRM